jgi:hypothetical protein
VVRLPLCILPGLSTARLSNSCLRPVNGLGLDTLTCYQPNCHRTRLIKVRVWLGFAELWRTTLLADDLAPMCFFVPLLPSQWQELLATRLQLSTVDSGTVLALQVRRGLQPHTSAASHPHHVGKGLRDDLTDAPGALTAREQPAVCWSGGRTAAPL